MSRRAPSLALVLVILVTGLLPAAVGAADPPLPASMAAVGDSITRAASTGGTLGADYPANSWATGTSTTVNSHALRLAALGGPVTTHNLAVSGAKMANLDAQMANVVSVQPDYVTVLMGGNDLCTDTVAQMTSVADFRTQFQTAMTRLMNGTTNTVVYVVSIPNVYQLWSLFRSSWWARVVWSSADICQSLLANPTSTQAADVQRRADVQKRNVDYNLQLKEICELYGSRCRFDNNAVYNTVFAKSDVSGDYFHPSTAGQAKLASVSWAAGYTWSTGPVPNVAPTAAFTFECSGLSCAFTDASTDGDGTIATRTWTFGDGATSSAANPTHTYAAGSTYTVGLSVIDDDGATASTTRSVTVTAPSAGIVLAASAYKVKGAQHADLAWSGAATASVVVMRNGAAWATTANDGAYTYSSTAKGGGSYTFQICETGTAASCSNEVTVSY